MLVDRLYREIENKGNVCVGLDTSLDYIPRGMKEKHQNIEDILFAFNKEIIDSSEDIVAIYKLQIAYYESYGIKGLMAYKKTLEYLKSKELLSIGDIKRGDISSTADMYARAHFEGDFEADLITLNPYMGFDSLSPYLKYLESGKKGIYVLMRTSNPGAKDLEYLKADGKYIYNHVGDKLLELGKDYMGTCGYSSLGAVVGGTHIDQAKEIRDRYEHMQFLIPGYGAQGGKASDVKNYLKDGNGGVVNSSRGIIKAYENYPDGIENLKKYTRQAVLKMREDLGYERKL